MNKQPSSEHATNGTVLFAGIVLILCVGVFILLKPFLKELSLSSLFRFTTSDTNQGATTRTDQDTVDLKDLPFVSTSDIWTYLEQGKDLSFIDIRNSDAFLASHVPHSRNIEPDTLNGYVSEDASRITLIVFSAGEQAKILPEIHTLLTKKHIPHFFITGGFEALKKEHYPLISFGDLNSVDDQSKVNAATPEGAEKYRISHPNNTTYLDVRSPADFAISHVAGALNMPLESIEERADTLPRQNEIIVYSADAPSTFRAAVRLFDLGFYLVHAVNGTLEDIGKAGTPLEKMK